MKNTVQIRGLSIRAVLLTLLLASTVEVQPAYGIQPGFSFTSAPLVTSGIYTFTLLDRSHYFKLDLQEGQTVSLLLKVPKGDELDLYLYDKSESEVDSSILPSDSDERVLYTAPETGFYFVEVEGSGTYQLSILITDFEIVSAEWGPAEAPTPEVGPGDVGVPLRVTIRNGAADPVTDLTATLQLTGTFTDVSGRLQAVSSLGEQIPSERTGTFTFTLNVAQSATVGTHSLKLTLDYSIVFDDQPTQGIPVSMTVSVNLLGRVNLDVSSDKANLTPGGPDEVKLSFRNRGTGVATSVEVLMTVPSGVTLKETGNYLHFDRISPGGEVSRSIPLLISSTVSGSIVQMPLSITYRDAYGNTRSVTRTLGFKVESERILFKVVESSWGGVAEPLEVGPGDEAVTLLVKVQNLGEDTVTGLHGTLHLKQPFRKELEGDMVVGSYGAAVQPGQTASFEFIFDVAKEGEVGRYLLPMTLEYLVDKGGLFQKGEPINLTVPILLLGWVDISTSPSVTIFKPDRVVGFTVTLTNQGSGDASGVEVMITAPPTVSLVEMDSHISIPSLKAGSSIAKGISVFVPMGAAGSTVQFTLSITYRDPYGNVKSVTRILGFTVERIEGAALSLVDSFWGSSGSPIEVGAGDRSIPVTLVVENIGMSPVAGITVEVELPYPLLNSTGGSRVLGYSGEVVQPGGTAIVRFNVDIAGDARPGGYMLGVSLRYLEVKGAIYEPTQQGGLKALLVLRGKTSLQVSVAGNLLTAETLNDVTISVKNTGGVTIYDVTATATIPGPISIASGSSQLNLSVLEPDEEAPLQLTLFAPRVAAGSSPQGEVLLTFKDAYGVPHSESRSFGLMVREWLSPIFVSTSENILEAGRVSEPTIEVRNIGKKPIYSLKATLNIPAVQAASPIVLISGSNEWLFESIGEMGIVSISPKILAALSAVDNLYTMQLSIVFRDSHGVSHSETGTIGFTVRGSASMTILSATSQPKAVLQGGGFTISGTILNKGTTSALYTSLSVKPGGAVRPTVEENVYLGEITPNAPFAFSIPLQVAGDTVNGTYPVAIVFSYEDEYGEQYTFMHEGVVTVGGLGAQPAESALVEEGGGFTLLVRFAEANWLYVLGGVAITILIIVAMVRRRRRAGDLVRRRMAAAEKKGG